MTYQVVTAWYVTKEEGKIHFLLIPLEVGWYMRHLKAFAVFSAIGLYHRAVFSKTHSLDI